MERLVLTEETPPPHPTVLPPWEEPGDARTPYRQLRGALHTIPNPRPVIALTSTVPGEGVSWIAARLACAIAEDTTTVFLVDASRAPSGHVELLGAEEPARRLSPPGMVRLYSRETARRGLALVAPDTFDGQPSPEALVHGLRVLLPDLRGLGGTVVVDAGPMHESGLVLQLAGLVDAVIYVVEAERERRESIARAQEALQRAGLPVVGVVLNKRRRYLPTSLYRAL